MVVTKRKLCHFVACTTHRKVIDPISFYDLVWKDIKEKLIAFYKDFYHIKFFQEIVHLA